MIYFWYRNGSIINVNYKIDCIMYTHKQHLHLALLVLRTTCLPTLLGRIWRWLDWYFQMSHTHKTNWQWQTFFLEFGEATTAAAVPPTPWVNILVRIWIVNREHMKINGFCMRPGNLEFLHSQWLGWKYTR